MDQRRRRRDRQHLRERGLLARRRRSVARRAHRSTPTRSTRLHARHRRRAHRVDRRAGHLLPRLSRCQRAAGATSSARSRSTAAVASPASAVVRASSRLTPSTDGPRYCAHAVKGKEAPPARRRRSDELVAEMRAHVRATAKDRPGVYRMALRRRRDRLRRQVEASCARGSSATSAARSGGEGRAHRARGGAHRVGVHAERVRRAARGAAAHQALPSAPQRGDEARCAALRLHQAHARRRRRSCSSCAARARDDAQIYYGPFHGAQRVSEAVRELNDALGLRDCRLDQPMHFADQPRAVPDLPAHAGLHPPRDQEVPRSVRRRLHRAASTTSASRLVRAFLDGADDGPMDALRAEMQAASEQLDFERAAMLRDKLQRLEELREQFIRFRFAVETLSFVYHGAGTRGRRSRLPHPPRSRAWRVRRCRAASSERIRLLEMVEDVFNPVGARLGAGPVARGGRAAAPLLVVPALSRRARAFATRRTSSSPSLPRSRTIPRPIRSSATRPPPPRRDRASRQRVALRRHDALRSWRGSCTPCSWRPMLGRQSRGSRCRLRGNRRLSCSASASSRGSSIRDVTNPAAATTSRSVASTRCSVSRRTAAFYRILDDSGDDFLYPASHFRPV